ncbi:hypothetical protein OIU78_022832, partial [Salix suchowensis]
MLLLLKFDQRETIRSVRLRERERGGREEREQKWLRKKNGKEG